MRYGADIENACVNASASACTSCTITHDQGLRRRYNIESTSHIPTTTQQFQCLYQYLPFNQAVSGVSGVSGVSVDLGRSP